MSAVLISPRTTKLQLNWLGIVLLSLATVLGIGAAAYVGVLTGGILAMQWAEPVMNRPTKGVGLAPDLSGFIEAGVGVIFGLIAGLVGGLLVGGVGMWLASRYLFLPMMRSMPALTRRTEGFLPSR